MQFSDLKNDLATVAAIPVVPFDDNGGVDLAAFRRINRRMIDAGVTVTTPNGNTGEFYSLSPDEHRAVVEAAVESSTDRTLVLAGVGFDVATAVEMARFATRAGARAVMVHQPVHPYLSAEGWINYNRAIAEAVPEVGIVPYVKHPAVTGAVLSRLADICPNLVGVKYGLAQVLLFTDIVQAVGLDRITWICGTAELWAPFFWMGGARGFTSGLVNVAPTLSLELLQCLQAGDYAAAMTIWARVKSFEDMRARRNDANNVPAIKEALAQMGLCERAVRAPITEVPEAERAEINQILVGWGML